WGYNPLNYNVLEGAYSSDATDGYVRIKEFKQVVQAFNGADINIIMDVVYNHVSAATGSNFDVLMPNYYFRYNADGSAANGSGCGNETASDHKMFQKFMIDSVCFWAREYKLGGFRFDLMGLHDIETMNLLAKELKKINPDIVVYGEPWTGGTSALSSDKQAIQKNGNALEGVGQFNDKMRDALIKGGLNDKSATGWITNDEKVNNSDVTAILSGLKGIIDCGSYKIADPNKTVNYVTCHDNYTLYDRIVASGVRPTKDKEILEGMHNLANAVVFTSNGTTFMLAGDEFMRTKGGDDNSYESSYQVNELDYALKIKNIKTFENYKKLIALKTSCAGLHLNEDQIEGNYTAESLANGSVIQITVKDTKNNRTYKIIHANGTVGSFNTDFSGYTLYLDTLSSGVQLTSSTAISPYQTIIAYK
ncbi:MAG: type I pullulanase, partial [Clostridia bacterium]|nr:type I pullulanase [Clostridia bacterium]